MSSKLIGQFHLNNNRSEAKFLSDPIFYVHDLFLGSGSKTFVLANFSLMAIILQPQTSKNTTQMVIFEFKAKIISDINNILRTAVFEYIDVLMLFIGSLRFKFQFQELVNKWSFSKRASWWKLQLHLLSRLFFAQPELEKIYPMLSI